MKSDNKALTSAFIGGAIGMYLMCIITCWQLCWLGAIIGGLIGVAIYNPSGAFGLVVKLIKAAVNWLKPIRIRIRIRVSNFISRNSDVISFIIVALAAFIGWTFAFHAWTGDLVTPHPWVFSGVFVAIISLIFVTIIIILDFFSAIRLYGLIWLIGGFIAMALFNPWLAGYTVPLTILAAKVIIAFVAPIFLTIGFILVLALIAALVGLAISSSFLACVLFLDACDWLMTLIAKIACAIFFNNRLLVLFSAATGAVIGHLSTGNPLFCLWGGFLGATVAWLLLFWRWSILIRNPRLSLNEIFKRCGL